MTAERWQRILRVMDEAFADYLTEMAALRKRVVGDVKRKLSDSKVLDHPRQGARSRQSPARKRGRHDSMLAATILLAQLHCAPTASGTVDCYEAQKGWRPGPQSRAEPRRRVRLAPERRGGSNTPPQIVRGFGERFSSGRPAGCKGPRWGGDGGGEGGGGGGGGA